MHAVSSRLARRRSLEGGSCLLALMAIVLLAGCGSSAQQSANVAPASEQTTATTTPATTPTTASTSAATPSSSGPPSFVAHMTTQGGDQVRIEGRFGPALAASESDVEESVLGECTPPANDGRAMVIQLDVTAVLESSLSAKVGFETSAVPSNSMSFTMGYSQGASCEREESGAPSAELGTLQPHQSASFTMWAVLADAITPNDPHPTEKTLGAQELLMTVPKPRINGEEVRGRLTVSGPRVVQCHVDDSASEPVGAEYIAVVGDTPRTLVQPECVG
jgi:hypothetical protein